MNKYSYKRWWEEQQKVKSELLFECEAESLLEADQLFEQQTKINPMKRMDVAVSISPVPQE